MSEPTKPCQNCGQDHVLPGIFCCTCEIRIQAVEPPQYLRDLRSVYRGELFGTPGEVIMLNLKEKSPKEFLKQLKDAEAEWREQVAKVKVKDEAEVDERQEKVEQLIDRLLEGL